MTQAQALLGEFNQEAATTRKFLEAVPFEKLDYKPHEKSMTLGRLSTHVAEIAGWWKECLLQDVLDFSGETFVPKKFTTKEELVAYFDDLVAKTNTILTEVKEEEFAKPWTMRNGETVYFTMPKSAVVRGWCLNHWYHHRAQLGVYLRMLNVAVPAAYGPTADDNQGM